MCLKTCILLFENTALANTEQEIHTVVKVRNSNFSWLFTAIYASPRTAKRHVLWDNLIKVAEMHDIPWVLAGDFNESLMEGDKFKGRAISVSRSILFKECLDKCNMIDIGFSGPRFTWTIKRNVQALIQKRIDRFFVNPSWCLMYPEAKVIHLTRCHSDHCPVLLDMQPRVVVNRKKPFKFQTCWLSDPTFPNIVSQAWRQHPMLADAIDSFSKKAEKWNRTHFGNVFARKNNIMARLNGIQRAVVINPSNFLLNLESELLKELDNVLNQEEEIWALKSRVNWMIQGDRNTAFYHVSTLVRRMRNQIVAIKDSVGEWLYEVEAIKNVIWSGFNEVYSSSLSSDSWSIPFITRWQGQLSDEERESISGGASVEEIKNALWSLKAFKSPGPDGLHARFFYRFWLIVGNSVIDLVKKVFVKRKVPESLNKTHIVLIPKIQGPETLGNYKPISLCNTVYKVITKIIVARLRPFLEKLISPLQTAFVLGRKGMDNAIIVQEIVHTLSKKKGKVGYMAIKVDLEKAYDKLEWSFIRGMLIRANLPADLIEIIMSCVSTVSTSILVNGEALDPIYPSRGIRQGDPLSPYLFILCMDFLGQLIQEKCEANLWQPIKASQSGPAFSHLLFADDLVLFGKADGGSCAVIKDVLDEFCSMLGQSVSITKSRMYFSPNVDRDTRESLCDILGFASTASLGKYLGFPIKQSGTTSQDFNFILDRVKQKLAGWKANMLSLAGQVVLIQASFSTIPSYVMQGIYLPGRILDGIDRVNRNFLWGSSEYTRKIHWVGWQKVTKPKDEGGLGLQEAKGRNTALLAKLNWRFHTEEEALWVRVLKGNYCSSRRLNYVNMDRLPCSQVWRAIKKGRETFNKGSMWVIHRGSTLSFWLDNWTCKGPIRSLIHGPLTREASQWKIKDVLVNGGWDWNRIPFELTPEIKSIIQAIPISLADGGRDRIGWRGNAKGCFDLKSAYSFSREVDGVEDVGTVDAK